MATTASLPKPSPEDLETDMNLARTIARTATAAHTSSSSGMRLVYSTTSSWPFSPSIPTDSMDVAVLDSSFNPPSLAHLSLLLSRPILTDKASYDGHLLLFSTNNADKGTGKPGDASLEQRVHMMTLLAKDLERAQRSQGDSVNVAVGLVDKPLIFAKSTLTHEMIKGKGDGVRLHWVVGFDTLYRVFQLKYYPSAEVFKEQCEQFFEQEGTTFVCARRDPSSYPHLQSSGDAKEQARGEEDTLLESENVAPWVKRGCIGMLDINPEEAKMSSTKIRELLKDRDIAEEEKRERLKGLVPPSLVEYLVEEGVYKE